MLRFGLLGCGRIGRVHADSIANHPRAELAVVYDPYQSAAVEVAGLYSSKATTDADRVFSDPSIDAVVIASPTGTHVDLLTKAVRAGKAVLCEKPIDLDLARVDACSKTIGSAGGTVMVGFNRRFDSSLRDVHDRVAAGEIGRMEQLVITSRDPAPPPASYIAGSGGLFRDMTIHDFDLARFFLGDIVEVTAMGGNLIESYIQDAGDIDSAMVLLRSADGTMCSITNSRRCSYGYDQRIEAFGAAAMLSVANHLPTSVRRSDARGTESAAPYLNFFLDRYMAAYRAELDHLICSVENGTPPSPSFADGRAALVLADSANESLRTGKTVAVT